MTYTLDQTLTALCIWEWMLEANRDDVKEFMEGNGAAHARQHSVSLAFHLEKAYETVKDEFDDAFDWEFVPAAMLLVEDWNTPIPSWPDHWSDRMLGAAILDAYEGNLKNRQDPKPNPLKMESPQAIKPSDETPLVDVELRYFWSDEDGVRSFENMEDAREDWHSYHSAGSFPVIRSGIYGRTPEGLLDHIADFEHHEFTEAMLHVLKASRRLK